MNQLKSFQDFRSEISIIELALSVGYKIRTKDGLKWPVLKDEISGDKIIIVNPQSTSNQGYFNPCDEKDKGTLINFIKNRLGSIFPAQSDKSEISNINAVLYNYQRLPLPEKSMKAGIIDIVKDYAEKDFQLPVGISNLTDTSYLNQRWILPNTINNPLFKERIFNVKINDYNNIGFPYYGASNEIVGFEIRNKQFKHVIAGSDRSVGIWHSNIPKTFEAAVLTESPIDALSYHQLKGKNNFWYVSFGGSVTLGQLEVVKTIIAKSNPAPELKIIAAVDNDKMGKIYTQKFKEAFDGNIIEDFPRLKDYNKDLEKSKLSKIKR